MEKIAQKFKVNDQIITKANSPVLVADSVGVIEFAFEFSDLWANVFKTAVITTGGETFNCPILNGVVSAKNMPVLKAGVCKVSVFGGDLITANEAKVTLQSSGLVMGEAPPITTPDVYAQLVGEFERLRVLTSNSATAAQQSEENANGSALASNNCAISASKSAYDSKFSEDNSKKSEANSSASAEDAQKSAIWAEQVADDARTSAKSAKDSECSAKTDAESAHVSAKTAEEFAQKVQSAIPKGGAIGQVLAKKSNEDYASEWVGLQNTSAAPFWQKTQIESVSQIYPVSNSDLDVAVTIADVDRSAASHDNSIPIPQYVSVDVTRCGGNLFNINDVADVVVTPTGTVRKGVEIAKSGTYTVSRSEPTSDLYARVAHTEWGAIVQLYPNTPRSFDVPAGGKLVVWGTSASSFNNVNTQINTGATALPYEPYKGNTYTMPADTVYPWDVVKNNGEVIHNTGYIASYNGETITTPYISSTGALTIGAQVAYQLETPYTTQLTATQIPALIQTDKYTPELNQCFSNAGQIQVGCNKDSVAVYNELTNAILSTTGG